MNKPAENYGPVNRQWWTSKRIACIALALLAALYVALEPKLEKWLGVELPSLVQSDEDAAGDEPKKSGEDDNVASKKGSPKNASQPKSNSPNKTANGKNGSFELEQFAKDSFRSPEGLVYTMGPRNEHRIEHIMRHAQDQPTRAGPHGVFHANSKDEVLGLLDKAYSMVKSNSSGVKKEGDGRRNEYTINMPNVIGFVGGESGGRQGKPKTKRLKLVLDGKRVITAFPVWPRGRR